MSRKPIPERDRKIPCAVSLTRAQRAKLRQMGGSPWLQKVLDAAISIYGNARKPAPRANLGARVIPGITPPRTK